ncbi:MAG: BTAD domain-containing putative transcriptional regulator, partial [Longimicrobiales bacterium]
MLRLRLLGTLALEDADGRTVLAHSKPGLLLAVLAATDGQRAPRGHLADLIWSGKSRGLARASLRQAIHHLAKLSPELPLDADKEDVWLDTSRITVDLWDFDAAIEERRLEDALAVYGGPFLGNGAAGMGHELQHWVEAHNDRIAIAVQVAYPTLVESLLGEGRDGAAVEHAQAYARLNPLNEQAQMTLVKTLLSTGDDLRGLQVYQAFRAQLDEDEGDEPSTEFQALIREIPHGVVGRPATVVVAPAVGGANESRAPSVAVDGSRAGRRSTLVGRRALVSAGVIGLGVAGVAFAALGPWSGETLSDRVLLTGVMWQDGSPDAVDLRITRRGVEWVTRVKGGVEAVRSPDGTRFATVVSGPLGTDITIVDGDGSREPAVFDKADERPAAWSPDGRSLLFSFGRLAEDGSYEVGAGIWDSETGTRSIVEGLVPVGLTQRLDWSPDGSRIAAITQGPDGSDLLTIVTPAGVIVSSESLGEGSHRDPVWSPDGEWIAFLGRMDGRSSISVIRPDGTDERVVVAAMPQPRSGLSWITSGHIAYLEVLGDEYRLMITGVEPPSTTYGYAAPHLTSMRGVPAPMSIDVDVVDRYLRSTAETVFMGLIPTWVDTIALTKLDGPMSPGQWIYVDAVTLDEDGNAVSALAPVEWTVSDTSLLWSDGRGLFRLMGEGHATITASLGGWRTSEIEVLSEASPRRDRRRWLVEDWTGGLDDSKWAT